MKICAEKFIACLKEKNMNFETKEASDGSICVQFPYQRKVTSCIFSGENGEYLSFYTMIDQTSPEKRGQILEACNKVHTEYKWITLYVDEDTAVRATAVKQIAEKRLGNTCGLAYL